MTARLGAGAAHLVEGDDGNGGVEDGLHLDSKSSGTNHGDLGFLVKPSQLPIRSPTSGWICASSHF